MTEPRWLHIDAILAAHDISIATHGGISGVRDQGLLESALQGAPNRHAYEGETDIAALAAIYAVGIAKNHPFADGNKRSAFVAVGMFLKRNGLTLKADKVDATLVMLKVASGEIDEQTLAAWLHANSTAL